MDASRLRWGMWMTAGAQRDPVWPVVHVVVLRLVGSWHHQTQDDTAVHVQQVVGAPVRPGTTWETAEITGGSRSGG